MIIKRRSFMRGVALGAAGLSLPRVAYGRAETEKRLVFVLQRGAADGLGIVPPLGDPDFARLRGALLEDYAEAPALDGHFSLHPALETLGTLYRSKQFLPVHAVASAYRDRSHFDGQNVLESGAGRPYARADGWLNRLLALLPGDRPRGLAMAPTLPLALRGPHEATSYAPSSLPDPTDDLIDRIGALYGQDKRLLSLWQEGLRTRGIAAGINADDGKGAGAIGALAASFLIAPGGARVAMIETDGWDTHSAQPARLAARLRNLDAMIAALKQGLGPIWSDTLVIVSTEFGRTATINGTKGTDHGTASAALLIGGPVNGGRVVADWPGLAPASLYMGRDLAPTLSLEAMIAGAIANHFRLDPEKTGRKLFPDLVASPLPDLVTVPT
jgi:uncharacterized protein (DUF1501 family)